MTQFSPDRPREVVVIGGGPAAHRLVDALQSRALQSHESEQGIRITVLADEPHLPYDRVALSTRLGGDADLTLQPSSDRQSGQTPSAIHC